MNYYYYCLFIFSAIAYFIVTDSSVARLFFYLSKILKFNYEKIKWWIINNPRNPIVKYLIWRRSLKLAEQLQKELQNDKLR